MRRTLLAVMTVLMLLGGSLAEAAAQGTGTPAAGGPTKPSTIVGADGKPEGTIVVNSLEDPFTDFDPSSGPPRGFHYVAADVTIEGTGSNGVASGGYFFVVDGDGFVYQQTYVYRTSDSSAASPDLSTDTVAAGQSTNGIVFFQVLDGVKVALVLYQPDYQRLVTVADLREAIVEPGSDAEYLASDGTVAGTITVADFASPFEDFDASSAPQRGFEFAAATLTITNSGKRPLTINPSQFILVDADGFTVNQTGIYRSQEATAALPDLSYDTAVAPGESVTGLIAFQVLIGTKPGFIYFAPDNDRHIRVAEYAGKAPAPSGTPVAHPTAAPADETPVVTEDVTPVADIDLGDVDCDAVVDWGKGFVGSLTPLTDIFTKYTNPTNLPTDDDAAADVKTLNDLADDMEGQDAPDVVQPFEDVYVTILRGMASDIEDYIAASSLDDKALVSAALGQEFDAAGSDELTALSNALEQKCPELQSALGG